MQELIERLQNAPGPSSALDKEILAHLGFTWRGMDYWHRDGKTIWGKPSHFTSSLDAARGLMPNDTGVILYEIIGKKPTVSVTHGEWYGHYGANTSPIALCIAALEARAAHQRSL